MHKLIKTIVLCLLVCPLFGQAFTITNETIDTLHVELVTTNGVWAWHQFTVKPGESYDEPFIEQPDKPTYYRLTIEHYRLLYAVYQACLSGVLHDEKQIVVTFEDPVYNFYVDGNLATKTKGNKA